MTTTLWCTVSAELNLGCR